jgi:hypothetical protein
MPNDPKKPQDEPPGDGDDDHGGSLAKFFKRVESDPNDEDPED